MVLQTPSSVGLLRYLVSPDQSLQVHYVTLQDAGRYTCTAVNDRGMANASAHLTVQGESIAVSSCGMVVCWCPKHNLM